MSPASSTSVLGMSAVSSDPTLICVHCCVWVLGDEFPAEGSGVNTSVPVITRSSVSALWILIPAGFALPISGTLMKVTGSVPTLLLTYGISYYTKAKNAAQQVWSNRSSLNLVGTSIDASDGSWSNTNTIPNYHQVFIESLIKAWQLFKDPDLLDIVNGMVKADFQHMAEIYNGNLWFKTVDMDTGDLVRRRFPVYALIYGMSLTLCGRETEARRFMESAYSMWSRYQVSPRRVDYSDMSLVDKDYDLNPELGESCAYLYYATGDETYRQRAYVELQKLVKYCKHDVGYTGISDVTTLDRKDSMYGFFLWATLKQLYLIFADTPRFDYRNFVFSTYNMLMRGAIPT